MDEDGYLVQAFLMLPFLAAGLFAYNHMDWVSQNSDYVLPFVTLGGLFLFYKLFPELWGQVKVLIPVLLLFLCLIGGAMFLIFGGGADAVVGFGAKAREQHIDSLR